MRFVPPIAALASGEIRFDGDPRARQRPMKQIIESLRALGVEIKDDGRGTLPFTVVGRGEVTGGEVLLDASTSSQFVSALLLAGARYQNGIKVIHSGGQLPSIPHIDMTIEVLAKVGIQVVSEITSANQANWTIAPGQPKGFEVTVEPDLSNAAAFVAAALAVGGSVTITNWPLQTNQAGDALRELIPALGGSVSRVGNDLTFTGTGRISGIDFDLHDVGELTPVIAALCALADTPSQLRGIGHLRGHETDRLAALTSEINNLGGQVTETDDGLKIIPKKLQGGIFKTYEYHRMAMAAAVLGLKVPELQVENIQTTSKTLPDFAQMWQAMVNS
jgi:3-phosphoshikimate 1-carboxyvinyltransferase